MKKLQKEIELHEIFRLYYFYIVEMMKEHSLANVDIRDSWFKKLLHDAQFLAQTSWRIEICKAHLKIEKGGWKIFNEVKPAYVRNVGVYLVNLILFYYFYKGTSLDFVHYLKTNFICCLALCVSYLLFYLE